MKYPVFIIGGILALLWTGAARAQWAQPPPLQPYAAPPPPSAGYMTPYRPSAPVYQPPIYVNPLPNGGYVATKPGSPPVWANPLPNGGYVVTQPGASGQTDDNDH